MILRSTLHRSDFESEFWAGSLLGGFASRFSSSYLARFPLGEDIVRLWCRRGNHALWPSDVFSVCAVSRHGHFIGTDWTLTWPRNGANRKRLAIFPFQPLAIALLRLPATINQTHMFPQPLAATNNAETRDLGLMTRGRCGKSWRVSIWYNDEHEKLRRRER